MAVPEKLNLNERYFCLLGITTPRVDVESGVIHYTILPKEEYTRIKERKYPADHKILVAGFTDAQGSPCRTMVKVGSIIPIYIRPGKQTPTIEEWKTFCELPIQD